MSIKMFPDDEVERISENVFIHKPKNSATHGVFLQVGVQKFQIGGDYDLDPEDANFVARLLLKAVKKLKGEIIVDVVSKLKGRRSDGLDERMGGAEERGGSGVESQE